jgi:acyl carrier protein
MPVASPVVPPIGDGAPVLTELADIIRTVLDDAQIVVTPATSAEDVPGWDSMTHIALVVETECRFGISFAAAEIEQLRNVGELVRLIEVKRAA